ncbi:hypothetical protein F8M41_025225 [Gigaspora margarita]|uniref:Uncharacterized protein n=1 Tax=Gigaspora margarita TaxID=4874 RepID=A0A8H3XIV2_GIGMA|nr:hypothetical protein F8M41_025225 [Gigaspora margarita]
MSQNLEIKEEYEQKNEEGEREFILRKLKYAINTYFDSRERAFYSQFLAILSCEIAIAIGIFFIYSDKVGLKIDINAVGIGGFASIIAILTGIITISKSIFVVSRKAYLIVLPEIDNVKAARSLYSKDFIDL